MRALPSLLLLCFVCVAVGQKQASPPHRQNNQNTSDDHKREPSNPAPEKPVVGPSQATESKEETNAKNTSIGKEPSYWHKIAAPEILPNWILAIVGVFGTIAAFWSAALLYAQVKEARKTSDEALRIAKETADASKANAEALMRSERARLLVDRIQEPYLVPVEESPTMNQRLSHCILFIKNFGSTPGVMVASQFQLQIGDSPNVPPSGQLYDMKPYTLNQIPITVPQQADAIPMEAVLQSEGFIRPETRDAILTRKTSYLWLCGIIRYYDVFERKDDEHETRICYMYETRLNTPKPVWRQAGPATSNKAT